MPKIPRCPETPIGRAFPLVLLLLAAPGLCTEEAMSIFLKGSVEVPPVSSWARGRGQITVLPDHTITGNIQTSGFVPTQAHVHEGGVGQTGPAIIAFKRNWGDDFGIPPGTKLSDGQYESYLSGKLYVNVHSALHPNGEIRAQLLAPAIVGTPTNPAYLSK